MNRSTKTVLLWLVLIVMMVAIYTLAGDGGGASSERPPDDFSQVWVVLVISIVVVGGAVGYRRWALRGRADNDRGVELLARGRYAEALAAFELARGQRDADAYRLNAASARLKLFRIEESLSEIERIERTGDAQLREIASQYGAFARALAGRATDADRKSVAAKDYPYFMLIRALHAVRAGAFAEAGELLDAGEMRQLGGSERALAEILVSWCALELRGERRPIDRTALFGEAAPDGLYQVWPELQAFLERHEDPRAAG